MACITGIEIKLGKYIKISPNIKIWYPNDNNMRNSTYFYLNTSFSI